MKLISGLHSTPVVPDVDAAGTTSFTKWPQM